MDKGSALYIHIPFCKQKCLYCDFNSYSAKEDLMMKYSQALSMEIDKLKDNIIETIFIGGGTPTYLPLECWNIIKNSIDKLKKSKNLEFTVEGNPGSFSEELLKFFKDMGVNRLSIGLQAWQDSILKKLGRIHSIKEFKVTFENARKIGFENINIDIMFGLPDQSSKEWKETLENVVVLKPEHISCYSLIIEEDTPFYKMYNKELLDLPDEETERAMYDEGVKYLEDNGYIHYEISNFSKHNYECRHNMVYWEMRDYIGCGAGAHSYIDKVRYRNEEDIEQYILEIIQKGDAIVGKHKNSPKDEMEEFMFMGLRELKGISLEEFEIKFNVAIDEIYKDVIKKHVESGLLIRDKHRIYLSSKGIEISNYVMSDFLL